MTDILTDSMTSFDLFRAHQVLWSTLTFVLMWNPFIVHLFAFPVKFFKSKCNGRDNFEAVHELKNLMFFLPFLAPIKNFLHTIELYKLGFGMRNFEAKNAKEVERIQHAAGSACMYESFLESGPQCVVQLKIILSTGSISYSQMISLPVSVLSLSWSSSRAYFIFRNKDNSDPDPDPKMVATRIFPWMLVVVIHSLTVWTCIVGLLGEYVFFCILTYFCAAFAFQISINRYINKSQQVVCNALLVSFGFFSTIPNLYAVAKFPVQESSVRLRTAACLCGILTMIIFTWIFLAGNLKAKTDQTVKQISERHVIKSVLTSTWLPCVVGTKPFTFFLSSMTSHINKNFLVLLAALLNWMDLTQTNVFLFWCIDETKVEIYEKRNLTICHSLTECFPFNDSSTTEHKIRVCSENQSEEFLLTFLILLNILTTLSVIASVQLENLTDYMYFYKSTSTFLCFPTEKVVHRSLVFTLASSDEYEELLQEVTRDKVMINRPRRGKTPLHYATEMNAAKCTEILLRNGAFLKQNGEDPPLYPSVIVLAVKVGNTKILEEIPKRHSKHEIMALLRQEMDHTLSKAIFKSPAVIRSWLNLILPFLDGNRSHPHTYNEFMSLPSFMRTPEIEFLLNRLTKLTLAKNILTVPTVLSLIKWKNQRGSSVFEDESISQENLKMMIVLALGTVYETTEIVPEIKKGFLMLDEPHFIEDLMKSRPSTYETIMKQRHPEVRTHKKLLSLAISDMNEQKYNLRNELRQELDQIETPDLLKDLLQEMKIDTLASLVIYDEGRGIKNVWKVSKFFPRMKEIISQERSQELKKTLKKIDLPPDLKTILGVDDVEEIIV